jgi:hypothetical protein
MAMGRPSTYTEEMGDKIIDCIVVGKSPNSTYRKLKVSPFTVREWRNRIPEFGARYEEAMEVFYKEQIDELYEESKNNIEDFIAGKSNMASVKRSDLIVNAIRQRLELMNPDKYGSKRKDWLHDCPEFGEPLKALDRLQLINKLVSAKKVSVQNAHILAQIAEIQIKCEDMVKLAEDVKQLKELYAKNEKFV